MVVVGSIQTQVPKRINKPILYDEYEQITKHLIKKYLVLLFQIIELASLYKIGSLSKSP
jgi:hypothetical protein